MTHKHKVTLTHRQADLVLEAIIDASFEEHRSGANARELEQIADLLHGTFDHEHDEIQRGVSALPCPAAAPRLNSALSPTHHLVTVYRRRDKHQEGHLVCIHCGKSEDQIRKEAKV